MQSPRSFSRGGAIISLGGTVLAIVGLFPPLLTGPVSFFTSSEWQLLIFRWQLLVSRAHHAYGFPPSSLDLFQVLITLLLTFPLLSALVVLSTCVLACLKRSSLRLLMLTRVGAINGLFVQSLIGIVALSNASARETIDPGFILLLLAFSLTVMGAFLSRRTHPSPKPRLVRPHLPSAHIGKLVSVLGVALVLLGLFLPMFVWANGTARSEWEALLSRDGFFFVFPPLLGVLIVLGTSVAAWFRELSVGLLVLRLVAALEGLILQLLLTYVGWIMTSIAVSSSIGVGSVLMLIGFALTVAGTFLGKIGRVKLQEDPPSGNQV